MGTSHDVVRTSQSGRRCSIWAKIPTACVLKIGLPRKKGKEKIQAISQARKFNKLKKLKKLNKLNKLNELNDLKNLKKLKITKAQQYNSTTVQMYNNTKAMLLQSHVYICVYIYIYMCVCVCVCVCVCACVCLCAPAVPSKTGRPGLAPRLSCSP